MSETVRCIIYARVSTDAQSKEDKLSIPDQVDKCVAHARVRDWSVIEVVRESHTGADLDERPEMTRIRRMVAARGADVLLVWHPDRLSRDPDHRAVLRYEFKKTKARWDAVTGHVSDGTIISNAMDYISGVGSAQELERLRAALQIFVENLADYQSYFAIMTFGMEVKTLQSFTNRPDKLEKTFNKLLKDEEGLSTHAYDAVDDAIRLLQKKSPTSIKNQLPKRAVILITDGFPVGDTVAPRTVIERANNAETSVYSVILPSFSRLQGNKKPLMTPLEASGLTEKTGGKNFYATRNNYEPLFKALAEEITASYVLAFYPSEPNQRDGKFHEVKIKTLRDYTIKQNRAGYLIKSKK